MSKSTTSHLHETFLYISWQFLYDYDVKMTNFAFYEERNQALAKFYFSFYNNLDMVPWNSTSRRFAYFWNNRDKDWKNTNSHFKRRCRYRCAVAS